MSWYNPAVNICQKKKRLRVSSSTKQTFTSGLLPSLCVVKALSVQMLCSMTDAASPHLPANFARLGSTNGRVSDDCLLVLCVDFAHFYPLRFGERPLPLDLQRDGLERPARRELLLPSHGSPGPEILICGVGAGGVPVVLSRARRHFRTGMRLSP